MKATLTRGDSELFDTRIVRVHDDQEDDDDDDDDDDEDEDAVIDKVVAAVDEATLNDLDSEASEMERPAEYKRKAERLIVKAAGKSRIFVFVVAMASSMLGTPFDSSTSLMIDNVASFLQCPANWDGAYNLRIATKGYEYEEAHAFFPLFPFVARALSRSFVLRWLTNNEILAAAIAGSLLNSVLFVFTSILLFRIGCLILRNDKLALRAALLFAWTPASIFFSVAYSESIFCFLAFLGIYILSKRCTFHSRLAATICFSLATLARSNGALLGLYSLWASYRAFQRDRSKERYIRAIVELGIVGSIHLAALLSVLGYGWFIYCMLPARDDQRRPWCHNRIPNIYAFIEEHYWNLGLFRYYEPKQIPNFVLAAPAFILSIGAVFRSVAQKPRLIPSPFLVQIVISIFFGGLFMHVQVFTRLVGASSPLFYWYAAEQTMKKSGISYLVYLYFAFYTMFGTAMFCSYFPWT